VLVSDPVTGRADCVVSMDRDGIRCLTSLHLTGCSPL
jgi:hypothetical protein